MLKSLITVLDLTWRKRAVDELRRMEASTQNHEFVHGKPLLIDFAIRKSPIQRESLTIHSGY